MAICIECGQAINRLYTEYGKGNTVLNQCSHCKRFADKYIEFEPVLLLIDMILHKPQVYRHIIFNRIDYFDNEMPSYIYKFALLILLFDIYIKWFQIEQMCLEKHCTWLEYAPLTQYFHVMMLSSLEQLIYHLVVRYLVYLFEGYKYAIFKYNYVSLSLIISSYGKLLLIAMIIWKDSSELPYFWLLTLLSFTSNIEALKVFLNSAYAIPFTIVIIGWLCKWLVILAFSNIFFDGPLQLITLLFT